MVNDLLLRAKHEVKQSRTIPLVLIFIIFLIILGIMIITYANTNIEKIKESQKSFAIIKAQLLTKENFEENGSRTDT